jgi:hypothetical protein
VVCKDDQNCPVGYHCQAGLCAGPLASCNAPDANTPDGDEARSPHGGDIDGPLPDGPGPAADGPPVDELPADAAGEAPAAEELGPTKEPTCRATAHAGVCPTPPGDQIFRVAAFSPDGDTLVTGGADAQLRFWTVGADGALTPGKSRTMKAEVTALAFSPEGTFLAVGTASGPPMYFVPPFDAVQPQPTYTDFAQGIRILRTRTLAFVPRPEGSLLVALATNESSNLRDRLHAIDLKGAPIKIGGSPIAHVDDGPDELENLTVCGDWVGASFGTLAVLGKPGTQFLKYVRSTGAESFQKTHDMTCSPGGRDLVIARDPRMLTLWDPLLAYPHDPPVRLRVLIEHNADTLTFGAAFYADGKTLALNVYKYRTGKSQLDVFRVADTKQIGTFNFNVQMPRVLEVSRKAVVVMGGTTCLEDVLTCF